MHPSEKSLCRRYLRHLNSCGLIRMLLYYVERILYSAIVHTGCTMWNAFCVIALSLASKGFVTVGRFAFAMSDDREMSLAQVAQQNIVRMRHDEIMNQELRQQEQLQQRLNLSAAWMRTPGEAPCCRALRKECSSLNDLSLFASGKITQMTKEIKFVIRI